MMFITILALTSIGVFASAFVQGPKTGCPPGFIQPKTAEECRAVAQVSNVRYWGGAGHSSSADPRGCIYRTPDHDIYFNTHNTGSTNRNDRRTVCVQKCEMHINAARKTECAWSGVDSVGRASLGGDGHSTEACLARCIELGDACMFAAVENSGYCHMFQTCDGQSGSTWTMYEKTCKSEPCDVWGCTCEGFANYYGTRAGISWGCADEEAQAWWKSQKHCNANPTTDVHPGCVFEAGSAEMFYSFQLKGDIGGEAVTISDGDRVVLTTEWADFSVASQSFTVSFLNDDGRNGQDMNVRFRSSMSTDIRLEEPNLAWKCGSENENHRCELVRQGVFAWEETYRIDFSAVDYFISAPGQNCDDKCMSIGGECREDMLFPQSEHMVREWAAQAGVECKSFQQRCDMGESPTFFEENGICTYCNDNTHPGWTDTRRKQSPLCQRRWGERERICPCSSSILPQEFTRVANVCVSATDTDGTLFSVGYIGTVDAVRLVHRSGSVSCNTAGGHRYSNWGCDPNNNGMTILITADDTSRRFPTSGTSGYSDISGKQTWYNLAGHTSSSNTLTFEGPQQTVLGTYRAVYGDALSVWNSHADNGRATCFDVYMKGTAANPTMKPTAVPSSSPTLTPSPEPTFAPVKSMVKDAFDQVKLSQTRFALPGLIRKAFHDAGHFDQQSGEMRMGCIQHFLSGKCKQHSNFEQAKNFVDAVIEKVPSVSMADAVQLLGALAVDELAQGTNAPLLYDRVRTGRTDPHESDCLQEQEMCSNLPDFSTRAHITNDHNDIVESLNDVWEKEISGKMMAVNTLSKQDAVALIGAHTVGRHFGFSAWVEQPMIFDNEYFLQLKKIKDWLDSGHELGNKQGHPFSKVIFPTWFLDSTDIADPTVPFGSNFDGKIMMLDSDVALVLNAPELVEEYASDMMKWRSDFDDAYVIMGELGVTDALEPPTPDTQTRRLLRRAEKQLDEDFEFFQNLQILREEQTENLAEIHAAVKF